LVVVLGHQKQFESLEAARIAGRMGHAYIFSGPDKIGKKAFALEWISRIFDFSVKEKSALPDFLFLAPLVDPKTEKRAQEITVDQIRGLISKLSLSPVSGRYKVAIIDEAHLMNSEAQNCLLKTLEEPSGAALLILVASNAERLLETVRSRCQILRFNFLPENQMRQLCRQWRAENKIAMSDERANEIVELSFGRPGRMVDFLKNLDLAQKWQKAAKEFTRIVASELPEKFAYAKKITDSENSEMDLGEIVEIWQSHFRNKLLESLKSENSAWVGPTQSAQAKILRGSDPRNPREEESAQFVFSKLKDKEKNDDQLPEKFAGILKKIQTLDFELRATNAHPRLTIENFLLDI